MGDPNHHQQFTRDRQQQQQVQRAMSSSLARYRSAPSSYFTSLLDSIGSLEERCDVFVNPPLSTSQSDQGFARFSPAGSSEGSSSFGIHGVRQNSSVNKSLQSQYVAPPMKSESENYVHDQQQLQRRGSGYSSASHMIHQNQSQLSMPNCSLPIPNPSMSSSYLSRTNVGGGRNTNLLRQSSSPAGFFSNFDVEGYGASKSMGNFGPDKEVEVSIPSSSRLKRQFDFPSGMPSSSGMMTPISEIENKNMEMSGTSFPFSSWDDSDIFSDCFLKELEDDGSQTFSGLNASENQINEVGNHRPPTTLSHHLSLPKTSSELSAMEKILQLQDSVPCKIRAKRGCATHPRSIAERVRRTKISERMRKLQELVPNMDKQTNTSDMLDLAIDYIKDLQNQLQTLLDSQANCTCSNQQTQ